MKDPIFIVKKLWLVIALIPAVLILFTMGDTACFSSNSDLLVLLGYIMFVSKWLITINLGHKAYQIIKKHKEGDQK